MWADCELDSLIPGWMCGGFKYSGIFPSPSSPLSLSHPSAHPLIDLTTVPKQRMEKGGGTGDVLAGQKKYAGRLTGRNGSVGRATFEFLPCRHSRCYCNKALVPQGGRRIFTQWLLFSLQCRRRTGSTGETTR